VHQPKNAAQVSIEFNFSLQSKAVMGHKPTFYLRSFDRRLCDA